jgi:hypothetical protein
MKFQVKFLVIVLLLVLSTTALSKTPVVKWTRQFGTDKEEHGLGVSVDSSGNAYVTGYTFGAFDGNLNMGNADMFLTKYDTVGNRLWIRQLGSADFDGGNSVSVDGNGNAYVAGRTDGNLDGNTGAGQTDIFLTKYDTNGVKQWTKQLGTTNPEEGYGVSVDSSGNAYVTGCTFGGLDGNAKNGGFDIFLTKYDMNGKKLWTRQLGSARHDFSRGVSVDRNSNVYVTGYTYGNLDGNVNAGGNDVFLIKYDSNGKKLWTKQLGTSRWDEGQSVSVDGNGNAYVTGHTAGGLDGHAKSNGDMFLAKYDTKGNKLWAKQLRLPSLDASNGISVDDNGNAYITGHATVFVGVATESSMLLAKYDTNGNKLWTKQLPKDCWNEGLGVSVDGSGNVYVTGYADGSLNGNKSLGKGDMFLIKISDTPKPK